MCAAQVATHQKHSLPSAVHILNPITLITLVFAPLPANSSLPAILTPPTHVQ
jgi:hypothetical protein